MNLMAHRTVSIQNKLGLHARAAARLVQVASEFESDINLKHGSKEVNGKSIMGVMMLAAGRGSEIELICNGPDEDEAIDKLEQLIVDRFGEEE